jgi:hypothetical protein
MDFDDAYHHVQHYPGLVISCEQRDLPRRVLDCQYTQSQD